MSAQVPVTRAADPPGGLPPVSGHQDALDGIRAVAAFAVLVFHVAHNAGSVHSPVPASWLLNGGEVGVAIFFTLSGLLLYRPWARAALVGGAAPRTRTYLWRRAVRILPAYWLLVAFVLLTAQRDHLDDVRAWGRLLTLTQIYAPAPQWNSSLGPREMGQAWSLAVEAAWYVALPVTAMVLAWLVRPRQRGSGDPVDVGRRARRLLWWLGGYALISFAYTFFVFVPEYHPVAHAWPPGYLAWFAVGMALSVVAAWARAEPGGPAARFGRTVSGSWGTCWLAALCLYVIAASPLTGSTELLGLDDVWTTEFHLLVHGLCAMFFIAPVALAPPGHPGMTAVLGNPVMRFLGRISYGVFLWQMLVLHGWYAATDRLFNGAILLDLPIIAAATIAAATLCYHLVEKPAQWLSRPRGGAAPSVADSSPAAMT